MTKRKGKWFLVLCVTVLAFLVLFAPSYGWRVRTWLTAQTALTAGPDSVATETQNEALQAQLATLQVVSSQLPQAPADDIRAMVYSRYPFNFKNEVLVNAGSANGVAEGKAVLFQGVLIGSVEKAYADSALVETVFDSGFKMPVRVGKSGYDALFIGGAYPKLSSIDKNAKVTAGDIVYAAAPGFPYGLPVAVVDGTSTSSDNLFLDASLRFAYDMNAVQTVLIAR